MFTFDNTTIIISVVLLLVALLTSFSILSSESKDCRVWSANFHSRK